MMSFALSFVVADRHKLSMTLSGMQPTADQVAARIKLCSLMRDHARVVELDMSPPGIDTRPSRLIDPQFAGAFGSPEQSLEPWSDQLTRAVRLPWHSVRTATLLTSPDRVETL